MMQQMVAARRGGILYAIDERYVMRFNRESIESTK